MLLGGLQRSSLIDYPGKVCAIAFTIGCNFRCPYCHNPELVNETAKKISEKEFFTFLESRVGLLDAVTVTGGEPTQHDDLVNFISQVKKLGFLVKLDSNGTRPEVLKHLIDSSLVDYVAMDIKSPLDKYSITVGRLVDFEKIQESIALLLENKVPYEFRTTVLKDMLAIDDFHEIGKMIEGAKVYYLQKFVPTKLLNPKFENKIVYSEEEFEDLRSMMEQYVEACHTR